MSKRGRRERNALLALGIIVCGTVLCALFGYLEQAQRNAYHDPPQNRENQESYESKSWWVDSLPQWIMAVFSIGATFVSGWAVLLVFDTLKATRKSNRISRRIGEQQLRPYIVYDGVKTKVWHTEDRSSSRLEVNIRFRNCGVNPGILTATSGANYAPIGHGKWGAKDASWRSFRVVIGPNQVETIGYRGISAGADGKFAVFTIGILVWYESLSGVGYEDYVWLTFDGTDIRQDYPINSSFTLYRPQHA